MQTPEKIYISLQLLHDYGHLYNIYLITDQKFSVSVLIIGI